MTFKKYQHVERWGNTEVQDIEFGTCHVFPKIDGTNSSVWWDNSFGQFPLHCGSRNRTLLPGADNAGFLAFVSGNKAIRNFLSAYDC